MTEHEATPGTHTASPRTFRTWIAEMPRWKKVSLLAAGALVVTGAVLMIVDPGGTTAPAGVPGGGADNPLQTGFIPGTGGTGGGQTLPQTGTEEPTAKGVFRLGFSFIAGFCLGAFVRATLKIASIAFGFWLAMTMVLAYFDHVVVDWASIDALWTRFTENVANEWGSFQRFVTGSLPAAGLVVGGFAIGVKRH